MKKLQDIHKMKFTSNLYSSKILQNNLILIILLKYCKIFKYLQVILMITESTMDFNKKNKFNIQIIIILNFNIKSKLFLKIYLDGDKCLKFCTKIFEESLKQCD